VLKLLVRLLGGLLALGCLGWIGWRFAQAGVWQRVSHSPYAGALLEWTLLAAPVYLLGLCALGLAWWTVQAAFLARRPPLRPLFAVYAVTQFAKYLPGNVGQYVGRHVMLHRQGMGHAALLMGTLAEAGFLVLVALAWAADQLDGMLPWLPVHLWPWEVLAAELVALLAGLAVLQALRARSAKLRAWVPLESPSWLLGAMPLQAVFFAAMAATLMMSAHALPAAAGELWHLPAVAAASWVAGFLVVGAPGGLGVREMVFLLLLRGRLPETDVLVLAAAFRVASFAGDALFLLLGLALGGARAEAGTLGRELEGG
jgi:hypothetical protein